MLGLQGFSLNAQVPVAVIEFFRAFLQGLQFFVDIVFFLGEAFLDFLEFLAALAGGLFKFIPRGDQFLFGFEACFLDDVFGFQGGFLLEQFGFLASLSKDVVFDAGAVFVLDILDEQDSAEDGEDDDDDAKGWQEA